MGAGETPIIALAPAVGATIHDATGIRPQSLPMAREGLKAAATQVRALRFAALVPLGVLLAGPTASGQKRCFSAHGDAVWVEHHVRAQRSADGLSRVEVRWKPDTSSQRQEPPGQAMLLIRTKPEPGTRPAARYTITEATPAVVRLAPGSYSLVVLSITYERSSLDVNVAPGDSIALEVRLRSADYCEQTVIIDETAH